MWDDYTEAFEDMLSETSTRHAPWFVIPSDAKWFRNLAVAERLVGALEMRASGWRRAVRSRGAAVLRASIRSS